MNAIMNPGAGRVEGARIEFARTAIKIFVSELGLESPDVVIHEPKDGAPHNGRFRFYLARMGYHGVSVDMPGLPVWKVRFTEGRGKMGRYPRLYVDGGSLWWPFALEITRYALEHKVGELNADGELCDCRSCEYVRSRIIEKEIE